MRHAIISDIHGNLHALEAVVRAIDEEDVDKRFCLGDVVGYGAFPNECIELVRDLGFQTVAGNHDFAVLEMISIENFNSVAKVSTNWTREQISTHSREFLESIPLVVEFGTMSLVHGTLYCPELFDYIQTSYEASLSLEKIPGKICFIGHSHIPVNFVLQDYISFSTESKFMIPKDGKALVNVGSVGQPRDMNPRSSFAIYDDETDEVSIRRIPYDIEGAISGIRGRGLPGVLGDRLRFGR